MLDLYIDQKTVYLKSVIGALVKKTSYVLMGACLREKLVRDIRPAVISPHVTFVSGHFGSEGFISYTALGEERGETSSRFSEPGQHWD